LAFFAALRFIQGLSGERLPCSKGISISGSLSIKAVWLQVSQLNLSRKKELPVGYRMM
jgi:hypothetical protein